MCETAGREGVITAVGQDEFSPWSWRGNGHGGVVVFHAFHCYQGLSAPEAGTFQSLQNTFMDASRRCGKKQARGV